MNLKRRFLSILCVMICLGLAAISGCKKSSDVEQFPSGVLLQSSGCKQFLADAAGQLENFAPGPYEDCLEFQYNGTNTLVLRHINAGFNCCPVEITAEIAFNSSLITITESEQEQRCLCLCLFDVDYEVVNLVPGVYTLRIIEPYVEGGDQVLELTLELWSATSGTLCLQRDYYPWN